jgi:hypothetical protein
MPMQIGYVADNQFLEEKLPQSQFQLLSKKIVILYNMMGYQ